MTNDTVPVDSDTVPVDGDTVPVDGDSVPVVPNPSYQDPRDIVLQRNKNNITVDINPSSSSCKESFCANHAGYERSVSPSALSLDR